MVGFDLDLTLLDARAGIRATFAALSAETGVADDGDAVVGRLGPPLETELAYWFPAAQIPAQADRYRQLYAVHAIPASTPMPGAARAVAAVRRHGGRVVVVTAKNTALAQASLAVVGLAVDVVEGARFADAKGTALLEQHVDIFVGDHVGDMIGARAGGAHAVGLTTGPCSADELRAAGADTVLTHLDEFPASARGRSREPRLTAQTTGAPSPCWCAPRSTCSR
ncbi:HAD family hydrolase [Candidatus Frankia nodulisporulans]|uniref:HAD family hydrolase n=1 Tax=Candidatus Frankia nodulisporulans TaxID=2060052 RepID=UPI001CDD4DF8|nr:haloacid dehalogenase-like hydrolase [Candidatus Frankia nodulisporulans]